MPDQLHPPYNITQPRVLIRWDDVNSQNGPLNRCRYTITIPAFFVPGLFGVNYSIIIGAFDYQLKNSFSFRDLSQLPKSFPFNTAYTLCVSYVNPDNTTIRYLLNPGPVQNILIPTLQPYTNQKIKPNFRIEIWSNINYAASQPTPIVLTTSLLQNIDYRWGNDTNAAPASALLTGFNSSNGLNLPLQLPNPPTLNTI